MKKRILYFLFLSSFSTKLAALPKVDKKNYQVENIKLNIDNLTPLNKLNIEDKEKKVLKTLINNLELNTNNINLKLSISRNTNTVKYFEIIDSHKSNIYQGLYVKKYDVINLKTKYYKKYNNLFLSKKDLFNLGEKENFNIGFPVKYKYISSQYNKRRFHPILKRVKPHNGIDFVNKIGTPIKAVADGIVKRKFRNGNFGKYIELKHKNGYITEYAHLSNYAFLVKPGAVIKKGQIIGFLGNTGRSTGPHLHFGIKYNNKYINPNIYLPKKNKIVSIQKKYSHNHKLIKNINKVIKKFKKLLTIS